MTRYGTSKGLAGNEIELGMMIPTIESRASNIPMTKGTTYVVMRFADNVTYVVMLLLCG